MAVLVEGISVVMRCRSIVEKFSGGLAAFMATLPNGTLCSDGELASVSFMVPVDVQKYAEHLCRNGLTHKKAGASVDFVAVDQLQGILTACDWADYGHADWNDDSRQSVAVCCARPTAVKKIVVPNGWNFEGSLSAASTYVDASEIPPNLKFVRHENGIDILVDINTGKEFYVRRS